MTDIVERLGRYGNLEPCLGADIAAAKAEIERLRKALKLAKEWGVDSDMGGKNPVSAALRHWIKGGMRGPLTTEQKEMRDD